MEGKKMWSLGLNFGTSFATPLLIVNFNGTIAPLPYSFFEFGFDLGYINGMASENVEIGDVRYSSDYFYGRVISSCPTAKGYLILTANPGKEADGI